MKIEDDEVKLGDRVWHDRYGWGVVARVQQGTCDVRFNQSDRLLTFTEGGMSNGYKVLYWRDPIVFAPRKGVDYGRFLAVVQSLLYLVHGEN